MILNEAEARELSALLFAARENIAMFGDILATRWQRRDTNVDAVRDMIDAYRLRMGWPSDGFGDERRIDTLHWKGVPEGQAKVTEVEE